MTGPPKNGEEKFYEFALELKDALEHCWLNDHSDDMIVVTWCGVCDAELLVDYVDSTFGRHLDDCLVVRMGWDDQEWSDGGRNGA